MHATDIVLGALVVCVACFHMKEALLALALLIILVQSTVAEASNTAMMREARESLAATANDSETATSTQPVAEGGGQSSSSQSDAAQRHQDAIAARHRQAHPSMHHLGRLTVAAKRDFEDRMVR